MTAKASEFDRQAELQVRSFRPQRAGYAFLLERDQYHRLTARQIADDRDTLRKMCSVLRMTGNDLNPSEQDARSTERYHGGRSQLGTEPEPRTKIAHESIRQMLSRLFVIALTVMVGLSYSTSLVHGQSVKLAIPETTNKVPPTTAPTINPSAKSTVVEAFDPAMALEAASSGISAAATKDLSSVGSASVNSKPAIRSQSGASKVTSKVTAPDISSDISIEIENSGTVIRIPEKSIATPAISKSIGRSVETPIASGSATNSSLPATPVNSAESVSSKISASAKRQTPIVVRALDAAPIFQEPTPIARAEPKATLTPATSPATTPASIAQPNTIPPASVASQPTVRQQPISGQASPIDANVAGQPVSDVASNPTTPTPIATIVQPKIQPNVAQPDAIELPPVQPQPMAIASAVETPSVSPTATISPIDSSFPNAVASNEAQTTVTTPTAVVPNSVAVPTMPEQVVAITPSISTPSISTPSAITPSGSKQVSREQVNSEQGATSEPPQGPLSPAERIAPYWTVEGLLAIKAPAERSTVVDLESLVWAALAHSPYVQSIKLTPLIRETEIQQAQGAFDPTRFVDSIWNDRSDPVGNTLTTGGPARLNDRTMNNKAGIRNKNTYGGNLEASQEIILHNSNSLFFIPRQQADAKMFMRYTQPLMRGSGQAYNRATITIAELNTAAAGKDSNQALQLHVMDLSEAYWQLFYHRSQLLQLRRGVEKLKVIAAQLENRRDLDLLENQLYRAQAAAKTFESRIARTIADIIDDEQRIRRFVNAPWIQNLVCDEIITGSVPMTGAVVLSPEQELGAAFINRPDVLAVRDEIQAARVKLNVAENELRPTLNLVTDMYVRGLNGQYDIANSLGDQFANGRPSYSGGLEYQRPRNLVLAKAIKRQRSLELQQILFRLDDRLLDVSREVLSAVAEVDAALAELNASVGSTMATKSELDYLESRWVSSEFLETGQISLNLEQLMDAQQRLVNAESSWALSQAQYMIALCRLRFSTGTLLTLGILDEPGVQPTENR